MRISTVIFCVAIVLAVVVFLFVRPRTQSELETKETPVKELSKAPGGKAASAVPVSVRPIQKVAQKGTEKGGTGETWESSYVQVEKTGEGGEESGETRDDSQEAEEVDEEPTWSPPRVDAATLDAIREAFARWRSSEQGENETADLRLLLEGLPRDATLAAAAAMMRSGTVQDRLDAMWIVENAYQAPYNEEELVRVNIDDEEETEGGEEGEDPAVLAEEARDAAETHDVVALVAAGFEDPNPEVRQAAYAAAMGLSTERNNILLSQLLCSDSPESEDLRRQLMNELSGMADDESITLFIAAMQSPDTATAALAKENLEAIAGRTFQDVFDAANWLEQKENPPAPPGTDADFIENEPMENKKGEIIE